jgi:N-acetylmuramoyl-L-alanine amidase
MSRWKYLVIHHSVTPPTTTLGDIDAMHRARGWNGIGYHFVIQRDAAGHGHLKRARPDTMTGAHAGVTWWNKNALGLCVIGCFHPGYKFSERMSDALYSEVFEAARHIMDVYNIPGDHLRGHRDIKATACPGDWFPLARLKFEISKCPELNSE